MDNTIKNSLVKALQKEFVRRNLIKFFIEKGIDNFLISPYPPMMLDISERIPQLNGALEVKYYLEDINLQSNIIKLGWNLFVLSNNRMFLGYTNHVNISEVENGVNCIKNHDGPITIKQLIEYVISVLGKSNILRDIQQNNSINTVNNIKTSTTLFKPIPSFKKRV